MTFRVIIQPAVAVLFAIRAGLHDAREGQPPFLWTVFSNPGRRHELLRQARIDVGNVFIVALVLDSIYQVMVHSGMAHPAFRGVGVTSSSISAPSNALPRFRTL
jgi:hypothetical protein